MPDVLRPAVEDRGRCFCRSIVASGPLSAAPVRTHTGGIMQLRIAILEGDDIGLEVVPEAVKVMKAAAASEVAAKSFDNFIGDLLVRGKEEKRESHPNRLVGNFNIPISNRLPGDAYRQESVH
jgi:hypothetical protein